MNYTYRKDEKGKIWLKVFYHDYSTGESYTDSELYFANSKNKLNLIGNITDKYRINGYFEFMIEYEEYGDSYYWKQMKNIKDTSTTDNSVSIGYVKMSNSQIMGGMMKSDSENALYDGIPSDKTNDGNYWWYYCLGIKNKVYDEYVFPGPILTKTTGYYRVHRVNLWLHVPSRYFLSCNLRRNSCSCIFISSFILIS